VRQTLSFRIGLKAQVRNLHSLAGNEPVSKPNFPTGGQMSFVRLKRFLPQLHYSLVRNNSRPLSPGSLFVSLVSLFSLLFVV
jgi:hypothetical protein